MHEKRNAYHYVEGKEFLHQGQMGLRGNGLELLAPITFNKNNNGKCNKCPTPKQGTNVMSFVEMKLISHKKWGKKPIDTLREPIGKPKNLSPRVFPKPTRRSN